MNRHGKSKAKLIAREPSTATLRPDREKSKDRDTTGNMLIEWDNLEVLKLLQNHYYEKIKCIYIDPPYNKDKDFVYRDTRKDSVGNYMRITGQIDDEWEITTENNETTGRKHSNWLSMMYPRLYLARKLLKDDGVIFVSIDEDEITNLRKLMDEIFGETLFIAQLTVLCNPKWRSQDKHFATNHEYVLVYTKSALNKWSFNIEKWKEQIEKEYREEDENGYFRTLELRNTHREFGKFNRRNLYYPLYVNPINWSITVEQDTKYIEVFPNRDDWFEGCWTRWKPKAIEEIDSLIWKFVWNRWKVYVKDYANDSSSMLKTILNDKSYYTEKWQKVFNELFENKWKIFQSPKSIYLLKKLFQTSTTSGDTILDFFAWSGTTGHAVMDLNAEDDGNRKYILVQLPELIDEKEEAYKAWYRTISEITRDRLLKSGEKIAKWDTGFRFFKLDTSNFAELDPITIKEWETTDEQLFDRLSLEADSFGIKSERSDNDIITELLIRYGYGLHSQINRDSEFPTRYKITDTTGSENSFFLSLEDTISDDDIARFVKRYHNHNQTVFVCKDEAISSGSRLTLANYFPWFVTL